MIFLAPSGIHGVGVFTDAPIPKGMRPDLWHPDDLMFVPRREAVGSQYGRFCVETADGYWCPRDFRCMSLGWYMNHSDAPSLIADGEEYVAACDLAAGEELTIDYATLDPEVDNRAKAGLLNPLAEFGIYSGMANAKKIALITGANKGLGFEMARQLGRAGVTVVLAARDPQKGEAAAEKLRSEGFDVQALKLDVTDKKDHAAAAAFLNDKFGRLDILINNAGILAEDLGSGKVSTTTEDVIHRTFETNFFAPVALTQVLLPLLKKSDAGRIVNMSSILGSQTLHADKASPIYDFKSLAYDSSKAALNSFSIHLAYELKDTKIKVNSAHPGWVKTDMGTDAAPMEIPEGGKTGVELALLGEDGPTGGFFHLGQQLPW